MSNLYHWHDERMNDLKLRDIEREIQHERLLKEAGISGGGGLTRLVRVALRWLARHKNEARIERPAHSDYSRRHAGKIAR